VVIGQALIKVNNPAGPVYGGVVVSEPWESKDDPLMFTEVSYLQKCSLPVIRGLQICVDVKLYYTTWFSVPLMFHMVTGESSWWRWASRCVAYMWSINSPEALESIRAAQ
jgi:hypothetical protein